MKVAKPMRRGGKHVFLLNKSWCVGPGGPCVYLPVSLGRFHPSGFVLK